MELKPTEHVIDLILNRSEDRPNYVLLLGAGASWNSNVKTANDMIIEWRNIIYERSHIRIKYSSWLPKQDWYGKDDEYSVLFEYLYDEQSQRRDYIEKILDQAHPSWGYVYLASLIQKNIFNAVFTTNFDDLINEACYLYTDGVRPIVCAHDSEVSTLRLTRLRPKIIKLHGDFLFDSISNISTETQRLTRNMETKFAQFGQEYGLVVVGYSGRDNSVMSILEKLLTKRNYFRHGIYWCIRKGEVPRKRVEELLKNDRVHGIEIRGFDELMAELHEKANLDLPLAVVNPMQVAEQRSRIFCSVPKQLLENNIIRRDIERVLDGLGKIKGEDEEEYFPPEEMPRRLKAAIMRRLGDLEKESEYLKLEVAENPDDLSCAFNYAETLAKLKRKKELKDFIKSSSLSEDNKTYFLLFTDDDKELVSKASDVLKKEPGSLVARINRAIAYKRLGKIAEMEKDLKEIEEREPDESFRSGIAALRKDKEEMLEMLSLALDNGYISTEQIKMFPVFEDYHNDEDLKKLVQEREEEFEE